MTDTLPFMTTQMTFTEHEVRLVRTFLIDGAPPEPLGRAATVRLPTKVTLEVSNPGSPDAKLMPVRVYGKRVRANGSFGPEGEAEPYWPLNWATVPAFVQATIRHAGLTHLTNLPETETQDELT